MTVKNETVFKELVEILSRLIPDQDYSNHKAEVTGKGNLLLLDINNHGSACGIYRSGGGIQISYVKENEWNTKIMSSSGDGLEDWKRLEVIYAKYLMDENS